MNIEYKVGPRKAVLRKLGLGSLVNTAPFDIAAAHEALVRRQAVPERIVTDGLIVDVPAGVYVISSEGKLLGRIPIPEDLITNLAFGGPDGKTLYVTAGKTLYRFPVNVAGHGVK